MVIKSVKESSEKKGGNEGVFGHVNINLVMSVHRHMMHQKLHLT